MATLDNESHQLCCLVLECLAHLFSWIPLSTSITPTLLASIFHFARFGCDLRTKAKIGSFISSNSSSSNGQLNPGTMPPTSNGGGRNGQQSEGNKVDRARLGVLAMTCVNELVSKNCVPVDFEEYLLRMFQQTFFLLQRLTRENNAHTVKSRLQELDERYGSIHKLKLMLVNLVYTINSALTIPACGLKIIFHSNLFTVALWYSFSSLCFKTAFVFITSAGHTSSLKPYTSALSVELT